MKKAIAAVLALIFVFALCACGNGGSSSGGSEGSKFVGTWELESFKGDASTQGADVKATMDINDDKTFTVNQTISMQGLNSELVITGTYEENGDTINCTSKHRTSTVFGKPTEEDINTTFTGTIIDGKLNLNLNSLDLVLVKK